MTPVFRKTMVAYISIVILAFAVLSAALTIEVRHVLVQQRLVVLDREAQEMLPYLRSVDARSQLSPEFRRLAAHDKKVDNTSVNIVLARNGQALLKERALSRYFIRHAQIRDARAIRSVMGGKTIKYVGRFSTFDPGTTLLVGLPIERNGQIVGALFLHTPVKGLKVGAIVRITFLTALFILVASAAVLYLTTRRLSLPLARMTRAVASFGRGNFHERIPIHRDDEIGQLADTFNEMASQLEHLEAMRKDLIANVSHEIRTPLTSVRGFIQGILEGVIPPAEHTKYLTTAHKELQRLNAILNSMLDLSAIESGDIQLKLERVEWSAVVGNVRDRVRVRMDEKRIAWRESYSDPSIIVWGDEERLVQILFNLLDNAIRHTSRGEIAIDSVVVDYQLHVKISDTGEGIAPDVLPHIWERFYSKRSGRGGSQQTGLGLTITRQLVELMHGRVDVESVLGEGTTFTIRLPILQHS